MTKKDKQIVRELAKQYLEYANDQRQADANRRMKETNDLKIVRPPVLIEEIPWHEMDINGELTCQCENAAARKTETFFRRALFRRKHFKADAFMEPFFPVTMAYDSSGIGVTKKEELLKTDEKNHIVSHSFSDVLESEESVELLQIPTFTKRPDKDEKAMNFYLDLLGDSIPVKLCGHGIFYHNAWDDIVFLRGMEPVLYDLYDRPEHLHAIRQKFVDIALAEMDFLEKEFTVDPTSPTLHCTPMQISGLADDGLKATWLRTNAQPFSEVSPDMHEEFDVDYTLKIADRFAYTYYGCCEPLDRKLDVICKIPNLRKIGVSPWAKQEVMAEYMGKNYVFSRKPIPTNVALKTDPDVIRKEAEETVRLCQKYGCPTEFVLKDISTVSYRPKNLIVWANTVSDVLNQYYGE